MVQHEEPGRQISLNRRGLELGCPKAKGAGREGAWKERIMWFIDSPSCGMYIRCRRTDCFLPHPPPA